MLPIDWLEPRARINLSLSTNPPPFPLYQSGKKKSFPFGKGTEGISRWFMETPALHFKVKSSARSQKYL
jgi:hypothetical protein